MITKKVIEIDTVQSRISGADRCPEIFRDLQVNIIEITDFLINFSIDHQEKIFASNR
ncbi:MAG: hypothetical protein ACXAE3_09180 [Candidatus Kariarchaeaceae archaeon]